MVSIGKYTYRESLNVHGCICRVPEWQRLSATAYPDTRVLALEIISMYHEQAKKENPTLSLRFNIPGLTSR